MCGAVGHPAAAGPPRVPAAGIEELEELFDSHATSLPNRVSWTPPATSSAKSRPNGSERHAVAPTQSSGPTRRVPAKAGGGGSPSPPGLSPPLSPPREDERPAERCRRRAPRTRAARGRPAERPAPRRRGATRGDGRQTWTTCPSASSTTVVILTAAFRRANSSRLWGRASSRAPWGTARCLVYGSSTANIHARAAEQVGPRRTKKNGGALRWPEGGQR